MWKGRQGLTLPLAEEGQRWLAITPQPGKRHGKDSPSLPLNELVLKIDLNTLISNF